MTIQTKELFVYDKFNLIIGFYLYCPLKYRQFKGQPFIPHTRSGYSSASSSYLGTFPRCHT